MNKKIDLEKLNFMVKGLPEAALALMPDDVTLLFLTRLIPSPITEQNAREMMTVMSLICRTVARRFNDLAQEQEKLIREWQN